MTEQEDEIRLKDLLDIYSKEQYKEIIEILNRDQKRYHKEQLILSGVVLQSEQLMQSCSVCGMHKHPILGANCKASNCPNEH